MATYRFYSVQGQTILLVKARPLVVKGLIWTEVPFKKKFQVYVHISIFRKNGFMGLKSFWSCQETGPGVACVQDTQMASNENIYNNLLKYKPLQKWYFSWCHFPVHLTPVA